MRWAWHVLHLEECRGIYKVLVEEREGKRPLGRPWHIWENNIRMDLQEVWCVAIDWFDVVQDRDGWRAVVKLLS
jgi:hypothetical protein